MNHHRYTDQIIGFAFGEVLADSGCVLTDLYVRTRQGQSEVEGKRGGLVVHVSILEGLLENADTMLAEMVETGANHDILPPARMSIPASDAGPTLRSTNGELVLCQALGVTEAVPEAGAIGALIEVSGLGEGSRTSRGECLIPTKSF